jgi:hypothetical protein
MKHDGQVFLAVDARRHSFTYGVARLGDRLDVRCRYAAGPLRVRVAVTGRAWPGRRRRRPDGRRVGRQVLGRQVLIIGRSGIGSALTDIMARVLGLSSLYRNTRRRDRSPLRGSARVRVRPAPEGPASGERRIRDSNS